jgi:hypothetical protein
MCRVAESPRPRLFKPEQASIVRQQFMTLQKKTLLHMVRRAHSSCAPNSIGKNGEYRLQNIPICLSTMIRNGRLAMRTPFPPSFILLS